MLHCDWNMVLRHMPRGVIESAQFDALKVATQSVSLTNQCDSWQWSLGVTAGFSVAFLCALVDDTILEPGLVITFFYCLIHAILKLGKTISFFAKMGV